MGEETKYSKETENFIGLVKHLTDKSYGLDKNDKLVEQSIIDAFNSLPNDQRILLLLEATKDNVTTDNHIASIAAIDHINKIELIRLKSWLVKSTGVVAFIFLLTLVVLYIVSDGNIGPSDSTISFFVEIIKVIINGK